MANSSAIIQYPETHGNLVRPGLAYYGALPYPGASRDISLAAALTWKSRVIFFKTVPSGTSISYARTWIARRPTRVATLAVGYADGYLRALSSRASGTLAGHRVKLVGRVSMDLITFDVTGVPERLARAGARIELIGPGHTPDDLATEAGTIGYEILTALGPRYHREYVG